MGQYVPPPATLQATSPTGRVAAATAPSPKEAKLLAKLQPLLGRVLEPGETVRAASRAVAPYGVLEFLTTGWIVLIVKRCALVFTERRILHIPTTRGFASRESVAQIRYGDVASFKLSMFGSLKLTYRNGKKETFSGISGREKKAIRERILTLLGKGESTASGGRHHLCPRCRAALEPKRFDCPACGLEFKSASRARQLSILIPGGGYFYTRHPILGVFDALVEAYLLVLALVGLTLAFGGSAPDDAAAGWSLVVFGGLLLALEKVITIYHASHYVKEYLPLEMGFNQAPDFAGATR